MGGSELADDLGEFSDELDREPGWLTVESIDEAEEGLEKLIKSPGRGIEEVIVAGRAERV